MAIFRRKKVGGPRTVLITGAASGLGLELSRNFLAMGDRVVLTGSVAGLVHPPVMSTYNATKAAVVALGETLDAELRPQGISTSVIYPQFFRSGLAASLQGDDPAADDVARLLLAKSWLNSETVAKRAMRGIAARRVVITPDGAALFSWLAKRFTRLGYLVVLRGVGYGVAWRVRRRAQ